MIKHTLFLEAAEWTAEGKYFGSSNEVRDVSGEINVFFEEDLLIAECRLRLNNESPMNIIRRYEIEPFQTKSLLTQWSGLDDRMGIMKGNFIINGDTIISTFQTADGKFNGTEYYKFLTDGKYKNKGILFKGKEQEATWNIDFVKKDS